jgi:hypothetical protein
VIALYIFEIALFTSTQNVSLLQQHLCTDLESLEDGRKFCSQILVMGHEQIQTIGKTIEVKE